jgi:dihydrolipoamide dehydrogenase
VTCLNPEIASVGYSEDDLIKRDLEYRKASVPITITGRANITNQRDGFTKILADKKTHQILGATVVSPHAGEVIHEITLAIQYGLTTDDIAASMHAFPSWSEAVRIACSKI